MLEAVTVTDCHVRFIPSEYKIWYPSQFFEMSTKGSGRFDTIMGDYELMADLDISTYSAMKCLGFFGGTFNGHLHKITGLNLNIDNGAYGGLFIVNTGTIKNLTVGGRIRVNSGSSSFAGLLCGQNKGRIERCYTEKGSTYSIESYSDSAYIGGLVGGNEGIIYNVVNYADLYGQGNIGGIVGKNGGNISESFISAANNQGKIYARINASVSIGGIVGVMEGGRIETCTGGAKITLIDITPSNRPDAVPCVGRIVGILYNVTASYGTQFAVNEIEIIGQMRETYIGGDIGRTILQPGLSL